MIEHITELAPQILTTGKLFLYMGIGVFLWKIKFIDDKGKQLLMKLVLSLFLPASIINSFLVEISPERGQQTIMIFFLSAAIQIFSLLLGKFIYRWCEPSHQAPMEYATLVSNSGILGTPVAEGFFGSTGTLLGAVYLIPLRLMMWTFGVGMFLREEGKGSGKGAWKKALTHPCIIAVEIGVVLMLLGIDHLPALLGESLEAVGNCNTVFAMILIGTILGDMDLSLLFHRDALYYSVFRLLLIPAIVLTGCRLIGISDTVTSVAVVLTAMPAASTTPILALRYGSDENFSSSIVAVTTVISLVLTPLWYSILT